MKDKIVFSFIILIIISFTTFSQTFLNGDFEINSAVGDQINLTNGQYSAIMTNSFGFGPFNGGGALGGDLDIITSNAYCNSSAQHGNWYVALTGDGTDAFSLKISSPLVVGQRYMISFYDRFCNPWNSYFPFPFKIGLSTSNNSFGDSIYCGGTPVLNSWTQRIFNFTAPNSGQYITVQIYGGTVHDWCQVDNFTIGKPTSIQIPDQNSLINIFPNPGINEINIILKDEHSAFKSIRVINIYGEELYYSNEINKIDISLFPPGAYVCEITTDQKIYFSKFIKQ